MPGELPKVTQVFAVVLVLRISSANYLPCVLILQECSGPFSVAEEYLSPALIPHAQVVKSLKNNYLLVFIFKYGKVLCFTNNSMQGRMKTRNWLEDENSKQGKWLTKTLVRLLHFIHVCAWLLQLLMFRPRHWKTELFEKIQICICKHGITKLLMACSLYTCEILFCAFTPWMCEWIIW